MEKCWWERGTRQRVIKRRKKWDNCNGIIKIILKKATSKPRDINGFSKRKLKVVNIMESKGQNIIE